MKADAATTKAVQAVLDRLAWSYAKRDIKVALSLFTPDVFAFGTGADEKRSGLAEMQKQMERDWAQTESTNVTYEWTSVSAAGDVAWVASDATFRIKAGGEEINLPARLTAVLEKRLDAWLIAQAHFSFPAASQNEGESFPASG